jgi:hypothetical protein
MYRVLGLLAALLVACFAASPADAACTANAGATIASAGTLTVGGCVSGGGNKIDYWKVALTGGDRVQLTVSSAVELDLYPPGTVDLGFTTVRPADVEIASPPRGSAQVLTIQAPYSATFVVAACQPVNPANGGDCRGVFTAPGAYARSMQPYTVTSAALGNACASSSPPAAGATISAAPALPLGACASGGGHDVDYWTVALNDGDQLQITVPPASTDVEFDLYAPGTTDDTFTRTTPTDSDLATTGEGVASPQVVTLTAGSAGTYVVAACEPKASATTPDTDCRDTRTGGAAGFVLPMKGYTFASETVPQPGYQDIPYDPGAYDFGPYGDTSDYGSLYGTLSIAKQTVSVSKKGAFRLTVQCSMSPCNGSLKLTARTGHGKKRKTTTLAETELSYLDADATRVSLTLTKPGLRLLKHVHGHLKATATLKYDTDTASQTTRAAITLRAR